MPITCHVTIGADIIHAHPNCDGAALGATSHRDFVTFAESILKFAHEPLGDELSRELGHSSPNNSASLSPAAETSDSSDWNPSGVFLNIGSAVTGPEVYLKALSLARNIAQTQSELDEAKRTIEARRKDPDGKGTPPSTPPDTKLVEKHAAEAWNKLVDGKLHIDQLKQQIDDSPDLIDATEFVDAERDALIVAVRKELRGWLAKTRATPPVTIRVRLIRGSSPSELGSTRDFTVSADTSISTGAHDWSPMTGTPLEYTYLANQPRLSAEWTPGTPITVLLEGERGFLTGGARPNLIEYTADGPLALWKLWRDGRKGITESGVTIHFEIVGCPGPDPGRLLGVPPPPPEPKKPIEPKELGI